MKETRAEYLPIWKLRPFEGHPFKVTDNEEMDQLVWSVLTQGLLTPLVVRPLPNGEYDVITIDTSSTKTITFATVSSGYRVKINTIEFYN